MATSLLQVRFKNIILGKSNKVNPSNNVVSSEKKVVDFAISHGKLDTSTSCGSAFYGSRHSSKSTHIKGCLKVETHPDEPHPIREERMVRFDTVEFREYSRVLSDNPSASSGPAIGIGWRYHPEEMILDLDLYELSHELYRREKHKLVIPPHVREDILHEAGYSRHEIKLAIKRAQKHKDQRHSSNRLQKLDPLLERVDTVKQCIKQVITSTK